MSCWDSFILQTLDRQYVDEIKRIVWPHKRNVYETLLSSKHDMSGFFSLVLSVVLLL